MHGRIFFIAALLVPVLVAAQSNSALESDAINKVHSMIGEARASGGSKEIHFITGHGVIKKCIIEVLEMYGMPCHEKMGNSGVLVTLVE